ncbi:hypothetical protein B7P43_G00730 [Cryptotermes secundus]|uniref:Uncharacterized protein n=1 Tax=Cryptotermes secundus TaxID=105785 RepID=A0A2J7QUF5_9NEOP|nr:hypothetical protein B7P43_G00730 [Cryptotermes secundus]
MDELPDEFRRTPTERNGSDCCAELPISNLLDDSTDLTSLRPIL